MDMQLRVKLLDIGMADAYRNDRDELVGQTGLLTKITAIFPDGYMACDIAFDNVTPFNDPAIPYHIFRQVRVRTIGE